MQHHLVVMLIVYKWCHITFERTSLFMTKTAFKVYYKMYEDHVQSKQPHVTFRVISL